MSLHTVRQVLDERLASKKDELERVRSWAEENEKHAKEWRDREAVVTKEIEELEDFLSGTILSEALEEEQ